MAKNIYISLLSISLISLLLLYYWKDNLPFRTMLGLIVIIYFVLVASIHGIVAHTLSPELKGGLIVYPLLMGVLFAVLFFICVFVVLPLFFPEHYYGSQY
jgi:hypothetical protein